MVRAGNRAAIVETTSHGLALDRVGGIAYDIAIFTNLTHEHLELHGTFEAYREAKLGSVPSGSEPISAGANGWPGAGRGPPSSTTTIPPPRCSRRRARRPGQVS